MNKIQVTEAELDVLRKIFGNAKNVKLFGSRIKNCSQKFSDLDVCICDEPPPSGVQMELWRETCENSNLSFIVDISRWNDLPIVIQENILKDGISL